MIIARHDLSEPERATVVRLMELVGPLAPDTSIKPAPDAATILRSQRRAALEVAYWIDLKAQVRELPLAESMCRLVRRAGGKPGRHDIVILGNLPIDTNPCALLLVIGSLMGEVREFVGHGAPFVEISDKGRTFNRRPSSDNELEFKLHTDLSFYERPPAFVAFLMLRQGTLGGESTFCDGQAAAEALPVDTVEALRQPFQFPAPPHLPGARPQAFPILTVDDEGGYSVRFRGDGLTAFNAQGERALTAWQDVINSIQIEVSLKPGEVAFFANTKVLHGRRAFQDNPTGNRRLALRAYVECAPLPP